MFWQVQPRHTNAAVRHAIVNVEAARQTEVIPPVNRGRKDDIGHDALALFGQFRRQDRLS